MEKLKFKLFQNELEDLIMLMTHNSWEYHAEPIVSKEQIVHSFNKGWYSDGRESYWIELANKKIGLIVIHDITDTIPLFDIRLDSAYRGHGYGIEAIKWMVDYIFGIQDNKIRIEAYTRSDNFAMRKTLSKCDFVKEGYLRSSWENKDGSIYDSICYSIIKTDWEKGIVTPVNLDAVPF